MGIYLNIGHIKFLANVRMLKFGSELRYGIRSPNVRTPVDIPRKKVHVGNDEKKAQSERESLSKNQGAKKLNKQPGIYTMKTYRKQNEQLFFQ